MIRNFSYRLHKFKLIEWLTTLWIAFFILTPSICAICLSFMTKPRYKRASLPLTLQHYKTLLTPAYFKVFIHSFLLASLSVSVCLLISYSLIFVLRKKIISKRWQLIFALSCLPFTANSLFRIYGLKQALTWLDAIQEYLISLGLPIFQIRFLYSPLAVVLGLVSLLFPFVFLPVWFAVRKIEPSQFEAARDLGASESAIFWHLICPLTAQARNTGFMVALLPAIGMFYVSDFLGGARHILWGNVLRSQLLVMKNPALASATCCLLFFYFSCFFGLLFFLKKSSLLSQSIQKVQNFRWYVFKDLFQLVLMIMPYFFYVLMFAPLIIIFFKAFFDSTASSVEISLNGFRNIFFDQDLRQSGFNSIILGLSASCVATVLGTISAFTQYWSKNRAQQFCSYIGLGITIILPEIALAIFLLGWLSFLGIPLGFPALLISHTAFCIPFVAFPLWSQLQFLDREMIESSKDLGARTSTIFFKIILPQFYSTLAVSFLLCFVLSIDDVVISSFFASPTYQTFSLYLYAAGRLGINQDLNALATVLMIISSCFFCLILLRWIDYSTLFSKTSKSDNFYNLKNNQVFARLFEKTNFSLNNKKFLIMLIGMFAITGGFSLHSSFERRNASSISRQKKVYLYTWSGYFPKLILEEFSKETGYEIVTSYFSSNEELYAQLDSYPNVSYDLILPSSYFLPNLIATEKIQPFPKKFEAIVSRVEPEFLDIEKDGHTVYSIPYLWGGTGICVNLKNDKNHFSEISSWKELWNPALKDKVFAVDDAKEMFYIARLANRLDSYEKGKQMPISIQKERENLAGLMGNIKAFSPPDAPHLPFFEQQAQVGILWNGSANLLEEKGLDIKFIWPKEGALLWIDNFCLPKHAKNLEGAFAFISFISRPEIAAKIVELTHFPSPYKQVKEHLPDELANNENLFPNTDVLKNAHLLKFDSDLNQEEEEEIEFQKLKLGV